MSKSRVYLCRISDKASVEELNRCLKKLYQASGFEEIFSDAQLTAVKTHFGEKGNKGYIDASHIKTIAECVEGSGSKAFVTDTNTLYVGNRANSYDHLKLAAEHGFSLEKLGVPVIIADGLRGQNRTPIPIEGDYFREVQLGPEIVHADAMVVMTHITGHLGSGFAGSIKNLAMGCATRGGKLAMHSGAKPSSDEKKCTACGTCAMWCPAEAIEVNDYAEFDHEKCIGCGECIAVCRYRAVVINWGGSNLQEKMAEYAAGVMKTKEKRACFINFINYVTPNCNCIGKAEEPGPPDVGIAASRDSVAVDIACYDLVNRAAGEDWFKKTWPNIDGTIQIRHAAKMGAGSMDYDLVEIQE